MDILWVVALLVLGILMVAAPKLLWKVEHFLSVKGGEPSELYLLAMRLGGIFFILAAVAIILYLIVQ